MKLMKLIATTSIIFLLLDGLWLGYLAKQFYIRQLGPLLDLRGNQFAVNYAAAVIVYFALIGGLIIFVLPLAQGNAWTALFYGAIFGFVTYATYDFTNLAVLKDWNWTVAIVDTLWGMLLCGLTACITTLIHHP